MGRFTVAFSLILASCSNGLGADPFEAWSPIGVDAGASQKGPSTGIPCDVFAVLQSRCTSCHGAKPTGNAPNSLLSVEDFQARGIKDPSRTQGELAVERMRDAKSPMPPSAMPPAAETLIVEKWVTGGMVAGTCGGSGADTGKSVCTTNKLWTAGNRGSVLMRPGGACITCHQQLGEGPRLTIGGTVYATSHEPNDCYGGGANTAQVVITDANNKVVTLQVNASGNFQTTQAIAFPAKAKVVKDGKERAMVQDLTQGDCNSCHTEQGAQKAPGRVMLP